MDNMQWYLVTTISGKERQVIESLENRKISENMENLFEDFKVMMIPHYSPRDLEKIQLGQQVKPKKKNLYPGYIYIKMTMTNEAWFIVRNTQYVTGLVGSSGQRTKPTPIPPREITKMIQKVEKITKDFDNGKYETPFKEGKFVEIIEGPTKGQAGPIISVNNDRKVAVVELIMFERKTPTEIEFKNLKLK